MMKKLYNTLNELMEREKIAQKKIKADVTLAYFNKQIALFVSSERLSALLNALIALEKMVPLLKNKKVDLNEYLDKENLFSIEYAGNIIESAQRLENEC